jgi:hypothetical protein
MEATPQLTRIPGSDHADGERHVDIVARADYAALRARLADDVVFHSPAARFNFRGPEIASALFETMVKQSDLDKWRVTEFWDEGDTHLMALTTSIGGRQLDLLSVTRLDEEGQIRETTVYARPMASIAVFPAFVFPRLVLRFRGRARAALVWLLCRPLPRILELGVVGVLRLGQPQGTDFDRPVSHADSI